MACIARAGSSSPSRLRSSPPRRAALRPPSIEQLAQETSVLLRRDRERPRVALPVELRERNKLKVVNSQAAVKPVQLFRPLHVSLTEHAQNIKFHAVGLEELDAFD